MKGLTLLLLLFALTGGCAAEEAQIRQYPLNPCRPVLSVGAIIEVFKEDAFAGIVLIERGKEPFGLALPGGKVEWGETVEDALRREMQEETTLELSSMRQFHVYSDPMRDKRHHTIEVTFLAQAKTLPVAGDDAKEVFIVPLDAIPWDKLTFDHEKILRDYLEYRLGGPTSKMAIP